MWKNRYEYMVQDDLGRWINTEFPPESFYQYPLYNGYRNANSEMLFYEYAIQYYDLRITYQNEEYFAYVDDDGAFMTDSNGNLIGEMYPTANDLIKSFTFPDGRSLPDIVQNSKNIFIDIL